MTDYQTHPVKSLREILSQKNSQVSLRAFSKELKHVTFSQIDRVEKFDLPVSKNLSDEIYRRYGAWIAPGHYCRDDQDRKDDRVKPPECFHPREAFGRPWEDYYLRAMHLGPGSEICVNGGGFTDLHQVADECFHQFRRVRNLRGTGRVTVFPCRKELQVYRHESLDDYAAWKASSHATEFSGGGDVVPTAALSPLRGDDIAAFTLIQRAFGGAVNAEGSESPDIDRLRELLSEALSLKTVKHQGLEMIESFKNLFRFKSGGNAVLSDNEMSELMWQNHVPDSLDISTLVRNLPEDPSAENGLHNYDVVGMRATLWLYNYREIYPMEFRELLKKHDMSSRFLEHHKDDVRD